MTEAEWLAAWERIGERVAAEDYEGALALADETLAEYRRMGKAGLPLPAPKPHVLMARLPALIFYILTDAGKGYFQRKAGLR